MDVASSAFPWRGVRLFVGFGLLYAGLLLTVLAIVLATGISTPVWPTDAIVIALLARSSTGDRVFGVAGAMTGWLCFMLPTAESAAFVTLFAIVRPLGIITGLFVIDRVAVLTQRAHPGVFEVLAAASTMLVSPTVGLLVASTPAALGFDITFPVPLSVWWGGATSALGIFLPAVLLNQHGAVRPPRPNWLDNERLAAIIAVGGIGAFLAIVGLPEPTLVLIVPLMLLSLVFRPADMAILSGVVWLVAAVSSRYVGDGSLRSSYMMPIGVGIGVLLPVATAVLADRLRQRERDLARSESLFHRSMQGSNVGVTIVGADARYLSVNAAFCTLLGYTERELIGRHFLDFVYEADREKILSFCNGISDGSVTVIHTERRYVRKDGEVFWARTSSIVVDDPDTGRPARLITQIEDIDLQKKEVQAIEESESRWAFALENGQQGVWDIDKTIGRLYTSPTWKRMLGYAPDDIVVDGGDAWLELMHPDDRDNFLAINEAHERGLTDQLEAEFRLRHKDGHWVWILDRGKVIARDVEGNPLRIIGTHTDISRNKSTELEIQLLEERLRLSVEAGGIGLWGIDLDTGRATWSGETFGSMVAAETEQSSLDWLKYVHAEDRTFLSELLTAAARDANTRVNTTCRLVSPTRGQLHIRVLADRVTLSNGDRLLLGTAWDISEQVTSAQALSDEKERLRTTLHAIADGVISTDTEGRVVLINPAAERMTGMSADEARGRPIEEVFQAVYEDSGQSARSCVHDALESGSAVQRLGTQVLDVRAREAYHIREAAAPIHGAEGLVGAVLVFQDVSAERAMQRSLAHAATHDDLTGLVNRRYFEARTQETIVAARGNGSRHGLLFIDLDRFKIVNDTAGHLAGDALLQEVARTMRAIVPASDCLARIGGDEFAVLVEDCDREFAAFVGEKLINAIGAIRFSWEGKVYEIGASAGVSQVDGTTASAEAVLAEADVACYAAKSGGRGRVSVYHQDTGDAQRHMSDFRMASRIRETIENGRFVLYAQEIWPISGAPGEGPSVELLIRMLDEDGEVAAPATFIPAAERFDLMGTIDRWVLARVIRDYGPSIMSVPGLKVAVNLSANSLNDPTLWRYLADLFGAGTLAPSRLTIEVTETAVINAFEVARDFIRAARGIGCQVSLDDFGSGLSSFTYLKSFDVDAIKIDGSFVHNMAGSGYDRTVVRVINEIGAHLGIKVIAERVEDEATLQALSALGVGYGQGYLFDRPRDFALLLAEHGAREGRMLAPLRA